jgi:hypothetical protein
MFVRVSALGCTSCTAGTDVLSIFTITLVFADDEDDDSTVSVKMYLSVMHELMEKSNSRSGRQ